MEKVTLFFCDICETFSSEYPFKVNDDDLKRFIENLNKLILYNESDKIIFSFVTTENLDTVLSMEELLKKHINKSNISIGKHIYSDGVKTVNKPHDILEQIKNLKSKYNISNNIYYADDSEFSHLMLIELKNYLGIDHEIKSIIPENNGLEEVNEIIENSIINSSEYKKIIK